MIRTNVVKLTTIPAVAFRQKLTVGGSGITILRYDYEQPGIASISKTSGKPILSANTPAKMYPEEAFLEAMQLTVGMPYHKQKGVKLQGEAPVEVVEEVPEPEVSMADRPEYLAVVNQYTDKNGQLSYDLINKDMIQFAHRSSIVRRMIQEGESATTIRDYVVGVKFRNISGNDDLTDKEVVGITELLDEVSPKGVYREFNNELKKLLKAAKK